MQETRGNRLEVAMRVRGLSKLSAMAAAVGVTESAISRWRHEGMMSLENMAALCLVLDISLDWLLLGRGHMEQHKSAMPPPYPYLDQAMARMKPHVREHLSMFLKTLQEDAD